MHKPWVEYDFLQPNLVGKCRLNIIGYAFLKASQIYISDCSKNIYIDFG